MIEAMLSKQPSHNRILLSLLMVVLYPSLLLAENIPLIKKGGVYEMPAEINGVITLNFILDTGASEVNIPADVALTLYRTGTIKDADFLPGQTYRLADGSQVNSSRFVLRSLKIGQRRITNVAASIGSVSSPLLLGQSFLEKLGAWGIDSQKQVLTLGTPEQSPRARDKPQRDQPVVEGSSQPPARLPIPFASNCKMSISQLPAIDSVRLLMSEDELPLGFISKGLSPDGESTTFEPTDNTYDRDSVHRFFTVDKKVSGIRYHYRHIDFKDVKKMIDSVSLLLRLPKKGWESLQEKGWGKNARKLVCKDFYVILGTGMVGFRKDYPFVFIDSIDLEELLNERSRKNRQ